MNNSATNTQNPDHAYREKWWRAVLAADLTPGQKLAATGLGWYMNFSPSHKWYRRAWKSAGELAKEIGMVETSTQDALSALRKKGWLKSAGRTTGGRGSHIYWFTIPGEVDLADVPDTASVESVPRQESESVEELGQSTNRVSRTTESVEELSQSQSDNWVRVSRTTGSESVEGLTDTLNDSLNESINHTRKASDDPVNAEKESRTAAEQFRDAYPKHAALHLIENPFKEQVSAGATEQELITAAENYAAECERTGQENRFMKFPTKFLSEEVWRNYLTSNEPFDWRTCVVADWEPEFSFDV